MAFIEIKQEYPWSCSLAVLAMMTHKTHRYVEEWFGYNGGEPDPNGVEIQGKKRRGMFLPDELLYLLAHGLMFGCWWNGAPSEETTPYNWAKEWALLTVESERIPGAQHAVFWTGEVVLDPNHDVDGPQPLSRYNVQRWWPVVLLPYAKLCQHIQPPSVMSGCEADS